VRGLDAEHPDAAKTVPVRVHPDAAKTVPVRVHPDAAKTVPVRVHLDAAKTVLVRVHPDAMKTVLVRGHPDAVKTVPKMTFVVVVKQANLWSSSSESVQGCRHARPTCLKHTLPYALHVANSAA
jgi:hypothetical protein